MLYIGLQKNKKYNYTNKNLKTLLNNYFKLFGFNNIKCINSDKCLFKFNLGSPILLPKTKIYINHPYLVKIALNKLQFLNTIKDCSFCIPFTTEKETVKSWLLQNKKVIAREKLKSGKGKGVVLIQNKEDLNKTIAKLFTVYIPKRKEYRLIVFNNKPIAFMRKILKKSKKEHTIIRNSYNYNYCFLPKKAIKTKEQLWNIYKKIYNLLPLEFMAIDIIKDLNSGKFYVLEVNTAPGLGKKNTKTLAKYILEYITKLNYKHILKTEHYNNLYKKEV